MHDDHEKNLARFLQDPTCEEYKAILLALNTYEFIASGIRTNAFNEKVYKRLRWSMIIKDWEAFEGFVIEFRNTEGRNSFFQDFEWLYKRWKGSPLRTDNE